MEEGFVHRDGDRERRNLAVCAHGLQQRAITHDLGSATDAERFTFTGYRKISPTRGD
jgi:hypothetical protein